MFNVLIGIIVGSIAKTGMQLAGATVIVVAVLTLVTNFAYNMWLLSKAEVPLSALTVSLRDWANIGLNFAINLLLPSSVRPSRSAFDADCPLLESDRRAR